MMILFILCTVFNMIIMLNLLIAIISESFAKINEVSVQASYQEKADIIAENQYLIPQERQEAFCEQNKYLLIATDVEQEMREKGDALDYKLEQMISKIGMHTDHIEKLLEDKINEAKDSYKTQLHDTLRTVEDENAKVFQVIKDLQARA